MTAETAHPITLVKDAVGHLQRGNIPAAEAALSQVLLAEPRNPDALGIFGFVRYRQGRLEDAAVFLARAIDAAPRHFDARMNLAYVLRDQGRSQDAQEAFSAVLVLRPDLADAYFQRGVLRHEAGKLEEAEQDFRKLLQLVPSHVAAKLRLSAILILTERSAEAESLVRGALGEATDKALIAGLEQNLGIVLGKQYRVAEAAAAYRRAQDANPGLTHLDHRRACLLSELGRFDEALALFSTALTHDPFNLLVHRDYNDLLYRLGRDQEFLRSYGMAAGLAPSAPELPLAKADLLINAERPEEAHEAYSEALRRDPGNPGALAGIAVALTRMKRFDAALDQLQQLIARQPGKSGLYGDASAVLAQLREPEKALAMAQRGLAVNPADQSCLALIGTAYRMLGDAREERHNGYDHLIRVFDLEPPEGYADMAAFNADLNAYLDRMHPILREFVHQSLRGGTQTTNNIFGAGHALVDKLRARIDTAIARYIAELPDDAAHPYIARRGKDFSYSGSWSSRLRDCGFHVNHLHTGWISSCYYIAVPDVVADAQAKQGWLTFGAPSYDVGIAAPARAIQPVPGRLVLFPSYTWHGTVPFHATQSRTTVAFDVVPSA